MNKKQAFKYYCKQIRQRHKGVPGCNVPLNEMSKEKLKECFEAELDCTIDYLKEQGKPEQIEFSKEEINDWVEGFFDFWTD